MKPTSEYINRRYTFALYPNKTQESELEAHCRLSAELWNAALNQREINYHLRRTYERHSDLKSENRFSQGKEIKNIRREFDEFASVNSSLYEMTLDALDKTFDAFFRKLKSGATYSEAGYPKYKPIKYPEQSWRPHHSSSFMLRDEGKGWKIVDRSAKGFKFKYKGLSGLLKARGKFPIEPDSIRTLTISRVNGRWYASVATRQQPRLSAGRDDYEVKLDLIDEFAVVKSGNTGRCAPFESGFSEKLQTKIQPISEGYHNIGSGDPEKMGEPQVSAMLCSGSSGKVGEPQAREFGRWFRRCSGDPENKQLLTKIKAADDGISEQLSDLDKRCKRGSGRWKKRRALISRKQARVARMRSEYLHRLTTEAVRSSKKLSVIAPAISKSIKTAKGNEKQHGAAVGTVATVNRHVLAQAPATCIAMLEYKAEEAGIDFQIIEDTESQVLIGREISQLVKVERNTARQLKKEIAA